MEYHLTSFQCVFGITVSQYKVFKLYSQRCPAQFFPLVKQYLQPQPKTGVRQQMNAALHNIFSDAEVGGKFCCHIRTTNIFSILTLCGRRDLCKDIEFLITWMV